MIPVSSRSDFLSGHSMSELISILCPTRGRPEFMMRMFKSAAHMSHTASDRVPCFEVIFYIDEDDQPSIDLWENNLQYRGCGAVVGPRINLSMAWNLCFDASHGQILFHGGDDLIFRTEDWDEYVKLQFRLSKDKILFVGGQDGFHAPEKNFLTHGFLHRNWVDTVGYFVPPYFSSDFNDTWLNEVADMIGRKIYLENLLIEHMHPLAGKHFWDRTHQERLERHRLDKPQNIYAEKAPERERDAEKLNQFIKDNE